MPLIGSSSIVASVGAPNQAAGLAQDAPPNFSDLDYKGIQTKYNDFAMPQAKIELGGKVFSSDTADMVINDVKLELSAGFESSLATFRIYNVYDKTTGKFRFEQVKEQVVLGNRVAIQLGYRDKLETVFAGFVAGVSFGYEEGGLPYIEVAAMDMKGIMMGSAYAKQCTAKSYSGAVEEILKRLGEKLKSGVFGIEVEATPDARTGAGGNGPEQASAYTIEMVSESDYEFVVKAAKKFNYEFFVDRGKVYFRRAKSDASTLMTLGSGSGLIAFTVEYSITGIVGNIEARAMDAGEGKLITANSNFPTQPNAVSTGQRAKSLVGTGKKVYIDPTIDSQAQAEDRVASLKEKMSYRLGTLEGECVGIPELIPGRFIRLSGLGVPVDNDFYLASVTHEFNDQKGFRTHIVGRANKVDTGTAGAGGAGGLQ